MLIEKNTPSETKLIVPANNTEYVKQDFFLFLIDQTQYSKLGNLIEKSFGGWRCKVCNKATNNLTNIRPCRNPHTRCHAFLQYL